MSNYTVADKSTGDSFSASNHNAMKVAMNSKVDYASPFSSLTDGATITWDISTEPNRKVTLGGNRTLAITNATSGMYGTLIVTQDATGSRTLTPPAGSKTINGGAGTIPLSTAAASVDIVTFVYDGTNYWITTGKNYT